jgi:proline dehydrogenase
VLRHGLHYMASSDRMRRWAIRNPVARRLSLRFVAGETLDDALQVVRRTNDEGMRASFDELGENVTSREEAEEAAAAYCQALTGIAEHSLDANVSCKATHLGLDLGLDTGTACLRKVVGQAKELNNFLRIDMEGSKYTQVTIELTKQMFAEYPGAVGTVIQSYLYRSGEDIDELNKLGVRVRLVKGAYLEPTSVAYQQKAEVDGNYRKLADKLLADGTFPAFATHDERLLDYIKSRAQMLGRKPEEFEFQMLYGVRRDLHRKLHDEGYGMRIYIPYGTHWYPYLMRRMAERPANLLFIVGNLAREARG